MGFKTIELKDYGVNDLQHDDFIKVGDVYFKHIPEDSSIVRITHSLEKARMRKSKTLHELRLKMKQISEVYAKEKKAFKDAERRKRIAGRQAGQVSSLALPATKNTNKYLWGPSLTKRLH